MSTMTINNFEEFMEKYNLSKFHMGVGEDWEKINITNPDLIKRIQNRIIEFIPQWEEHNYYTYIRSEFIHFLSIEFFLWSIDQYTCFDYVWDYIRKIDRKDLFIQHNLRYWKMIDWIKCDMDICLNKLKKATNIYPNTNLELERIYLHLLGFTSL